MPGNQQFANHSGVGSDDVFGRVLPVKIAQILGGSHNNTENNGNS